MTLIRNNNEYRYNKSYITEFKESGIFFHIAFNEIDCFGYLQQTNTGFEIPQDSIARYLLSYA